MADAAKHAGVRHVIWSTLEDTGSGSLGDRRMPTLMEKYKVPHSTQGEANRLFSERGSDDVPADLVLLENLIYFGWGPGGRRRKALYHPAHGRQEAPWDRLRGYRKMRLRHFRRGREFLERRSHRRRPPDGAGWRRRLPRHWGRRSGITRCPRSTADSDSRGGGSRKHVPVQSDFESIFCGARSSYFPGRSSLDADVRVLARGKRGRIPIEEVSLRASGE